MLGGAIALSVTQGRRFENLGVRGLFFAVVALSCGGASFAAYAPLKSLVKRVPVIAAALFTKARSPSFGSSMHFCSCAYTQGFTLRVFSA